VTAVASRWIAIAAVLVAMTATSAVWIPCSVATIRALGGRVSAIVLGWFVVARVRVGRTELMLGLLPISASVSPRFPPAEGAGGRPGWDLPEERSLEALPLGIRLAALWVPWAAVVGCLAAAGGAVALASLARGTWQVLVPVGAEGRRLAAVLVDTAASGGLGAAALAVAPKIVAASVDTALAIELVRSLAPRAAVAVFAAWLALAAGWAWAIVGAG
jgi:hypothetical protein